jgi:protein-disulfide isomerase
MILAVMRNEFERRAASLALVAAASVASVLAVGRTRKPFSPDAPPARVKGPADAKVVIVEFSDFECPACRYAEPIVRGLLKLHEGKVRFVFKHFPLERVHRWARPAAVAAECAERQGKFWELHDRLYDEQEKWSQETDAPKVWEGYAKDAKLDVAAWKACLQDPSANAPIDKDEKDGLDAWVGSTPTFFINGRRFVGAPQLGERGSLFIEKELKK